MKELLKDIWAVLESTARGLLEVTGDVAQLAWVEDPFWRGVVMTLAVGGLIMKRQQLMAMLDKIPLVGGVLVFVPRKIDEGAGFVIGKIKEGLSWLRSKTIDPVKSWVSKADKDLRD